MKEQVIKLSELVEVMDDFEEAQKIACFEKSEKQKPKFFTTTSYVVSYKNMWNSLKKQLIKKIKTQSHGEVSE